jgi:hypothetical protein
MYTGTLIEELLATVERAEQSSQNDSRLSEEEVNRWFAQSDVVLIEQYYQGVA